MKIKDFRKYWIWLANCCGKGTKVAVNLVNAFGNAYNVFMAPDEALDSCNFRIEAATKARLSYKECSEEEDIVRWCDENGVRIICADDKDYPRSLRGIENAPLALYCIGKMPMLDEIFTCAVVGTRSMSSYGEEMAYKFGYGIAKAGGCLVSGLALGCDASAIRGALDAGGKVIAVLGCGIDVVYPKENISLYERIPENGAVITEYCPGVSPVGKHFPVRNRIISGLSQATCVIEGGIKSGSLITARHAVYQGRDVFAIPGNVGDNSSEGTNFLIKNGATAVTGPEDVLDRYEFIYPHSITSTKPFIPWIKKIEEEAEVKILPRRRKKEKKKEESVFETKPKAMPSVDFEALGEAEKIIYRSMTPDVPMLAEEISAASKEPIATVMAAVTMLELAGVLESGAGGYYMRHADDEEVGEPAITEFDMGM